MMSKLASQLAKVGFNVLEEGVEGDDYVIVCSSYIKQISSLLGMVMKILILSHIHNYQTVAKRLYEISDGALVEGWLFSFSGGETTAQKFPNISDTLSYTQDIHPPDMKFNPLMKPHFGIDLLQYIVSLGDVKPLTTVGNGERKHTTPCDFQIYFSSTDEDYIKKLFTQIKLAEEHFDGSVECSKRYFAHGRSEEYKLSQCYCIEGSGITRKDREFLMGYLNKTFSGKVAAQTTTREVDRAEFYQILPDGTVVPSGPRNIPSGAVGETGMRGAWSQNFKNVDIDFDGLLGG